MLCACHQEPSAGQGAKKAKKAKNLQVVFAGAASAQVQGQHRVALVLLDGIGVNLGDGRVRDCVGWVGGWRSNGGEHQKERRGGSDTRGSKGMGISIVLRHRCCIAILCCLNKVHVPCCACACVCSPRVDPSFVPSYPYTAHSLFCVLVAEAIHSCCSSALKVSRTCVARDKAQYRDANALTHHLQTTVINQWKNQRLIFAGMPQPARTCLSTDVASGKKTSICGLRVSLPSLPYTTNQHPIAPCFPCCCRKTSFPPSHLAGGSVCR